METTLAFSIDDPDFKDFLPSQDKEILNSRWTDFNIHDPGVTTLEAIKFSMEDLIYKYNLPIEDLLQGKDKNALSTWNLCKLRTQYAISENDYRRIASSFEMVSNAIILPVEQSNTPNNTAQLCCLLEISLASNEPLSQVILEESDKSMLKNRAIGEYFNRQKGDHTFARERVKDIDVSIEMKYMNGEENDSNAQLLREKLANYLQPELKPLNFRNLNTEGHTLMDAYEGPNPDCPTSDWESINTPMIFETVYRNCIVVGKLYKVIQNLPFVASVNSIGVKMSDETSIPYEKSVLNLGEHTFTRLNKLSVNNELVNNTNGKEAGSDKLLRYNGADKIQGSYRNLGDFKSLQLSFPPNYGLGHNIVPLAKNELDRTASFRRLLALMDQARGNISAQMENLSNVFSISPNKPEIATKDLTETSFYKGLGIPNTQEPSVGIKNLFEEQRLNYLLALNGWNIESDMPYQNRTQNLSKIKQEYLNLIGQTKETTEDINKEFNPIFQATSIIILQERLRSILSKDIREVRILEHCFLQPVANNHFSLNFELSIFLFSKPINPGFPHDEQKVYIKNLIASFVPTHVIAHIHCMNNEINHLDNLLKAAYHPEQIFYFDQKLTDKQLQAMIQLRDNWVLNRDTLMDTQ